MLSYYLLFMSALLVICCLTISVTMTSNFKNRIKCYRNYLKDYKMKISFSKTREYEQIIKDTKRQYAFLIGFLVVMTVFSGSLMAFSLMHILNKIDTIIYTSIRIILFSSIAAGSFFVAIFFYKKHKMTSQAKTEQE